MAWVLRDELRPDDHRGAASRFSVAERPAGLDGAPTAPAAGDDRRPRPCRRSGRRRRGDSTTRAAPAAPSGSAACCRRSASGPVRRARADRRRLAGGPRVRRHRAVPALGVGVGAGRHRAVPRRVHRRRRPTARSARRSTRRRGSTSPTPAGRAGGDRPPRPRHRHRLGGDATRARHRPDHAAAGVRHPGARRRDGRAEPDGRRPRRRSACSSASSTRWRWRCGSAAWRCVARVVLAGPGEEDLVQAVRGFSRISRRRSSARSSPASIQLIRLDGGSLFSSSHGRVLLLKTVAVAAMLFVGRDGPPDGVGAPRPGARDDGSARRPLPPRVRHRGRDRGRRARCSAAGCSRSTPPRIVETDNADYPVTVPFVDDDDRHRHRRQDHPGRVGRNGIRVEVKAPRTDLEPRAAVRPAGRFDSAIRSSSRSRTSPGSARPCCREPTGIPLDDAGTWTIELSVVTATGALTGATSSFDVAPADGRNGHAGRTGDRDQRDRPQHLRADDRRRRRHPARPATRRRAPSRADRRARRASVSSPAAPRTAPAWRRRAGRSGSSPACGRGASARTCTPWRKRPASS